jgi:hypothetical protein
VNFGNVVWKLFAALPAGVFWYSYSLPIRIDGSENWLRFALLLFTTALSALLLVLSIILAIRKQSEAWWLVAALHIQVVVMFFAN